MPHFWGQVAQNEYRSYTCTGSITLKCNMTFVKILVAEDIIHTRYILKLFLDLTTLAYINYKRFC